MNGIAVVPFGYDPFEDLLHQFHTDTTSHTGRTFLEHLKGTERILREWGMPEHVCIAGLFHSIYGTNIFTQPSASFSDREFLQLMLGEKAERLAYLFCVIARPVALISTPGTQLRFNNFRNRLPIGVTREERYNLIAIDVANHIEQDMGAQFVSVVWDKPQHNLMLPKKAMDDMRRFMYKHGITR